MSKYYTEEHVRIAARNDISRDLLTTRMVDGWDIARAITQPPRSRRTFTDGEKEMIKTSGYAKSTILKRLYEGFSIEEACEKPLREQTNTHEKLREWSKQEATRLERLKSAKARRHREQKPHLYDGTPQKVKASDWYKYLAENDIFPKRKVEC